MRLNVSAAILLICSILFLPSLAKVKKSCCAKSCCAKPQSEFVTVRDGNFYIGDKPYRFVGTNFWYGPILASKGEGGDRQRLHRELDSLKSLGITNLRVLAGADGADGLNSHIWPVLHPTPDTYNQDLLEGLDYFLAELEKRDMKAVIYLTNAWEWSGGYSTYLEWTGHGKAPLPNVEGYDAYVDYAKQFVLSDSCRNLYNRHLRNIVGRVSSVTGKPYSESPAIMAWQICNEPRAFSEAGKPALCDWLLSSARAIKEIDPNHLVSTGSEGMYGCHVDLDLWTKIHTAPEIDYAIIHLWPYNWGWQRRGGYALADIDSAINYSAEYIDEHLAAIATSPRPFVIEEFGYSRDADDFVPGSPVKARDLYYDFILKRMQEDPRVSGVNFWGWAGEARPLHEVWQPGDPYMCDPAQEPQGLFSVFSCDTTTISLLRNATKKLRMKN